MDILSKITFNEEGFMTNPYEWNKEITLQLAKQEGLYELTPTHRRIIDFSRASGNAPALRLITVGVGITTKELFSLCTRISSDDKRWWG